MSDSASARLEPIRSAVSELALAMALERGWNDQRATAARQSLEEIRAAAERGGAAQIAGRAERLLRELDKPGAEPGRDPSETEIRVHAGVVSLQRMLAAASAPPRVSASPPAEAPPLAEDPEAIADFALESREHLDAADGELLRLETGSDPELVHSLFRRFHTIKGLAGFLDLGEIGEVAHAVESLLGRVRDGRRSPDADLIDAILAAVDHLRETVEAVEAGLATNASGESARRLIERLEAAAETPALDAETAVDVEPRGEPPEEPRGDRPEEPRGEPAEEPRSDRPEKPPVEPRIPPRVEPTAADAATSPARRGTAERSETVRVRADKLDRLIDAASELVIAQTSPQPDGERSEALDSESAAKSRRAFALAKEVQALSLSLRMVPIGPLFERAARLARDLARKTGKQVRFEATGAETEVDKAVAERLADPLLHMIRNAVDHGIEPPEERRRAGKPAEGGVAVRARHESGRLVVEVADDGRGLDAKKIIERARRRGIIGDDEEFSEAEARALVFRPGFSTAENVSDLSGRGVGMDVVKRNVEALRGTVGIESVAGRGVRLRLTAPLTLALFEGLVLQVGEQRYIAPLFAVREIAKPTREAIATVGGGRELALSRGRPLPILRLHRRFGVAPKSEAPLDQLWVVVDDGERRCCLCVDACLGKQEIVLKTLDDGFGKIPGVAGAAVLSDGRIGLVLDIAGLLKEGAAA